VAHFGQYPRGRVLLEAVRQFEESVDAGAASMDDPLRDALVVEMVDLLAKDHVLQQRRTASVGLELILIVCDGHALVCRQPLSALPCLLMGFASGPRVAILPTCHQCLPFIAIHCDPSLEV